MAPRQVCVLDADCPGGSFCGSEGLCAADHGQCSTTSQCLEGFFCQASGACTLEVASCPATGCLQRCDDALCSSEALPCFTDLDCPAHLGCGAEQRCRSPEAG